MKRLSAGDIVLKALGLLLLTAAVLKSHELLTVPAANKDLGSWRPFLIFQVEFELALGIWLLADVFKRLAWLASLACFALFSCVTLYKALTGAASCGCFGRIHVNPWITLLIIDLPAVIALVLFRPHCILGSFCQSLRGLPSTAVERRLSMRVLTPVRDFLGYLFTVPRFVATAAFTAVILSVTTPILILGKPAAVTSTYEVLEPKTWVGKELPILRYIDVAEQIKGGNWLVLFYHHDCPGCREAIPRYERMAQELVGNEDFLRIAFVEIPPYGPKRVYYEPACTVGSMANAKQWFIATPATVLVMQSVVKAAWTAEVPNFEKVILVASRMERIAVHTAGHGIQLTSATVMCSRHTESP